MSLERSSVDDDPSLETVVGVLDDAGCRQIVSVLEEPMTVEEVAESTDLPLSTTYRKLDRLTDASLVSETGVRAGRNEKARYVTDFDRIAIDLDDDRAFRVRIQRAKTRALDIWTTATKGR